MNNKEGWRMMPFDKPACRRRGLRSGRQAQGDITCGMLPTYVPATSPRKCHGELVEPQISNIEQGILNNKAGLRKMPFDKLRVTNRAGRPPK